MGQLCGKPDVLQPPPHQDTSLKGTACPSSGCADAATFAKQGRSGPGTASTTLMPLRSRGPSSAASAISCDSSDYQSVTSEAWEELMREASLPLENTASMSWSKDRVKREAILRLERYLSLAPTRKPERAPRPSRPLPAALEPSLLPLVKPLADKDAPASPEEALAQLQAALLARRPLAAATALRLLGLGPASAAGVDCDAVLAQEREVAEALEMLAADGDSAWRHLQYKDVLSLWYRQVPHSSRHHLKMKVEVAHPIKHLVAMMHEWDLMSQWNKMCMEPMVVERASIFEARVYTGQWIPSPFKDANILLNVRAFDLADEHSSLLVLFESEDLDVSDPRLPTAVSQRRTIDVLPGSGIRLQALPAGPDGIPRSLADIHLDFDPHFPYVPSVLVSFLLRVLCPYLYNVIIKVLDSQFSGDQGCMYEERVASRPDLYKYLDRRLQGFQPSPAAGA
ncbi:hypothetical protein ACKKBG_A20745 [Auxenochlorella protothecoides x Auxenochlorella symbiontica]